MVSGMLNIFLKVTCFQSVTLKAIALFHALFIEIGYFQSQRSFCYNLPSISIYLHVDISFFTNMSNLIFWGKTKTKKTIVCLHMFN